MIFSEEKSVSQLRRRLSRVSQVSSRGRRDEKGTEGDPLTEDWISSSLRMMFDSDRPLLFLPTM